MAMENGCGLCSVKIQNISVVRGRDTLLEDISFEMRCGELIAIVGANGAGKTTLLRAILGEMRHSGGVTYETCDGKILDKINIGYVPQCLEFDKSSPVSVTDFLLAGQSSRPVWLKAKKERLSEIKESLAEIDCEGLENRTLGELSGGELQRIMLLRALKPMPELLILDEPASGIDTLGSERFYRQVSQLRRDYHMAIAMTSHDLGLVREYADSVLLINKTVLKHGSVNEVYNSAEFRRTFGGNL